MVAIGWESYSWDIASEIGWGLGGRVRSNWATWASFDRAWGHGVQ